MTKKMTASINKNFLAGIKLGDEKDSAKEARIKAMEAEVTAFSAVVDCVKGSKKAGSKRSDAITWTNAKVKSMKPKSATVERTDEQRTTSMITAFNAGSETAQMAFIEAILEDNSEMVEQMLNAELAGEVEPSTEPAEEAKPSTELAD